MNSVQVAAILGILASLLVVQTTFTVGELSGQEMAGTMHEHLTGVSCDDVTPGQKRPEFGCFNIATENGLGFQQPEVYWHIQTFANRAAAEAAKSATGIVVEEDGRVWLSEFGARDLAVTGGQPIAIVGPLMLPPAKSYTAVLSYAVMRPGAWRANDRIRSEGSKAVAEAAASAGVSTLVQESVSLIYSDGDDEWLDESSPVCVTRATEPVAVAETNAQNFANTWRKTAVLRFGNLVGDDDFTRWRLARTSAGQPIGLGDPEGWAHVLHTDDVGSAVLAALTARSGVYNVGAEPVRRGELADVFARAVGRERSGFVPKVVVRLAGERLEPLTRSQRVSSGRLAEQTGWKPVHGSFGASWLVGVNMGFHERRRPA